MGRKKPNPPVVPVQVPSQPVKPVELEPDLQALLLDDGPPTLAHVCREALERFGAEVPVGQVRKFILAEYTGFVYNEETLSATLSNQRKKFRAEHGDDSEPSAADLLKVAALMAEKPNFSNDFEEMLRTMDQFGGQRRLKRCLRALEELNGVLGAKKSGN